MSLIRLLESMFYGRVSLGRFLFTIIPFQLLLLHPLIAFLELERL